VHAYDQWSVDEVLALAKADRQGARSTEHAVAAPASVRGAC